ncbi:type II secretion system protein [Vibrio sp. SM6]|uniref:Type II secretion system protein n=1 Tax=Vibrio agarilyticus TaxID=2726741 RepID=A0A7X8YIN9_9VIBR|nr:type II secretion system protein [Vibrio agarilyticus]NLS14602.1 type II secretion system protein [Vibrio agarilyticus]
MKKQAGFTLIELVVVIVILGILAVTAAPKFLNLQDDARDASLEGLRGAIASAMGISYGRAAIEGIETVQWTESVRNKIDDVEHSFGYPTADDPKGIGQAIDKSTDFIHLQTAKNYMWITYGFENYTDNCVLYHAAKDEHTPATVKILDKAGQTGEFLDACKK